MITVVYHALMNILSLSSSINSGSEAVPGPAGKAPCIYCNGTQWQWPGITWYSRWYSRWHIRCYTWSSSQIIQGPTSRVHKLGRLEDARQAGVQKALVSAHLAVAAQVGFESNS